MSAKNDFLFHKVEDGSFVRKCFGMEWLTGCTSEYLDGMTHLTVSASVNVPAGLSVVQMKRKSKEAWISLRHIVPSLACKSFRCNDKEAHYAKRYVVPRGAEDIDAWVSETIFYSETITALEKSHNELRDGHWWLQSLNKYVAELHISPTRQEDEWHVSLSCVHNSGDGRSIFQILELYLDCLSVALETDEDATHKLVWGDEVNRLPPPASFIKNIISLGAPPSLKNDAPVALDETQVPAPKPWLYPLIATGNTGDLSRIIKFSAEETAKMHAIAKAKGRTMTHLLTALTVVANAEAVFKIANEVGIDRFREILTTFEAATHYPTALNFINHRHKLPGGYDTFKSRVCSPLVAYDGAPLLFSLSGVKKLLKIDREKCSVSKVIDMDAFWDLLVGEVAEVWSKVDTSLEAYHSRDRAIHEGLGQNGFDPGAFHGPFGIVSSIGDLGRLNILNDYIPATSRKEKLTVIDLIFGIRLRIPCFTIMAHQYNEELSCLFLIASEFTTREAFQFSTAAFEEWARILL